MKIKTRLNISACVSLGVILVMAVSVVWSVIQFRKSSENLSIAGEIRNIIHERTILRDEYFIYREDRALIQWNAKSSKLNTLLKEFAGRLSEDSDRAILDEVFESYADTLAIFHKIVESEARTNAGGNETERIITREYENRLFNQLLLRAYGLDNGAARLIESLNRTAISMQRRIAVILGICVILLFLALFINGALLNRIIKVRLTRLRKGTKIIGGGNLDHRVDDLADDEISELARAINEMAARLKRSHTSAENLQAEIAERKQAEASQARLLHILESSLNEIYVFDAESLRFEYVNQGALRNLGYTLEAMQNMTPLDLKPEFTEVSFREAIAPLLIHEMEKLHFTTVHRRADGSLYPVEIHLQMVELQGQRVFLAVILDITERKQVEESFQQKQAQLQAILDYSPALISIKDPNGNIILANQSFAVLDAPPLNEFVGKNVFDVFTSDIAEQLWKNDLAALNAESPVYSEEEVKHKDGAWHTYFTVKFPIYLKSDQPFGICAISNDITERKQAGEALTASEARYRRFFEATRDGVLILDAETGMVVDVNPFLIELLGYSHEVFLGKKIWELGFFRDIVANQDNFLELQQKEYIRYEDMALETSDGGRIEVEFTSHVYLVHHQKVIQCNIRDISDRKRAEAALQQSSREVQEKNVELERFLYTVSHDLKSPVVTIRAFLGYLEQDMAGGKTDRVEKDMRYIRAAADKMAQLLDELLEFSRIDRVINPPVRVTLRTLVDETLAAVAGNIAERGVRTRVDAYDLQLYGDRPRLVEIWQNLIENAVKFMGGQPEPCIEIGAETRDTERVFFVRDNGIGIDPRFQAKIFGLFEKLDAKAEGTGIGLAIVQRIVGLYGGRIWVESEGLGQGSCFYFTLPGAENRIQESGDRIQNENTGDEV